MKITLCIRPGITSVLIILSLALSQYTVAQVRVSRVTGPEMLSGKKGIVYTLPRTRIHVDLWISKTQQYPGPLAEFAAEYLGIDEVITKNTVTYSIEKATINTSLEADPGQVYLVEKEEKSSGETWISFGGSAPVLTLETFDKTISPQGFSSWNKDLYLAPGQAHLFSKYTDSPRRDVIDTIIRKVSIDTLVFEKKIYKHSMVEFTDREKAMEASEQIRQIERDKYNLLIGYQETAYSRETLEFMINELEMQRMEYLSLFSGVSVKETYKFDYIVIPEAGHEGLTYKIAGFSKSNGIIAPDGQNDLTVDIIPDETNILSKGFIENQSITGIVYRVPVSVLAVLSYQGKEMDSQRIEVMQLGSIIALPPEVKRVEFNPETGRLQSVVID